MGFDVDPQRNEIVQLLIDFKANVNATTWKEKDTALHGAAKNGYNKIVVQLLAAKATINAQTRIKATPVLVASESNHVDTVRVLANAKANVNLACGNGWNPIIAAAFWGHISTTQCLIEAKACVDQKHSNGTTAVMMASSKGHSESLHLLLQAKGDVHQVRARTGECPLLYAALTDPHDCIKLLLEYKANVNQSDKTGVEALYLSVERGCMEAVRVLVASKANIASMNGTRGTALTKAQQMGRRDVAEFLTDQLAKQQKSPPPDQ